MYGINLYPPIFSQSYVPAFQTGLSCKIYFSLSDLNTLDDLYHITANDITTYSGVQITVKEQSTNMNALKSTYTNDIMLATIYQDETREGSDKYYVEITNSDIQNGFIADKYYKVQIRFTGKDVSGAPPDPKTSAFGTWLGANIEHFSEWSTVVLIRGINSPTLTFKINNSSSSYVTVNTNLIQLTGAVTFSSSGNERLQTYRIKLIDTEGTIIEDSGDIFSENNQIYYVIKSALKLNEYHIIELSYITNNLFTYSNSSRRVRVSSITPMASNMSLQQQINNNAGYIKLILKRDVSYNDPDPETFNLYAFEEDESNEDTLILVSHNSVTTQMTRNRTNDKMQYTHAVYDPYWKRALYKDEYSKSFLQIGNRIVIRRTSSRSDFTKWAVISDFEIEDADIVNLYWYDYTAEPGVWYRYEVVRYDGDNRTATLLTDVNKPVMLDSEDIFLNSKKGQLIVKFDPSIANITSKIAESVTETIGSKYPFFRRNGNVNYKTFSLSGTISCFMDIENNMLKASKQEVFGSSADFYKQYNEQHQIDLYNDYIYQKFFREKVMEFLQNNDVKLFRSLTQGNVLIKLNGISFIPNQVLGRLIYNFSCTAYEIDECNADNYNKYKILDNSIEVLTKADVQQGE